MTNNCHNMTAAHWETAHLNYVIARKAADAVVDQPASQSRGHIFDALEEAIEALLAVPAPTLGAFAAKLVALWGESLFCEYERASQKRMIVGDIRRAEMLAVGVDEPEASGGMNQAKIKRDWEQAGSGGDPDMLLSLPSPDIHGVVRKLELLWGRESLSSLFGSSGPHGLLQDLRRLALQHWR